MRNKTNFSIFCSVILLTILLFSLALSVSAQEGGFLDEFDDPSLPGWNRSQGVEAVDGVLSIGPESFTSQAGSWDDLKMTINLRRHTPGGFVIIFRGNGQNGYIVLMEGQFLILQRESEGDLIELKRMNIPDLPVGEWLSLNISAIDGEVTVSINETEPVLTYNDPAPLPAGGITIETFHESHIELDDLLIMIPGQEMVQPETGEETGDDEVQAGADPAPAGSMPTMPWVATGGPIGGLGYDIRMDPRDSNIMYVTDALSGAFKSNDGGANWFPINDGITARVGTSGDGIPVFSLTVDPNNPDILWVGTQFGGGVFRSGDGGMSWQSKSNGIQEYGLTIRGYTIEPGNSDVVYLAGEISSWEWNNAILNGIGFDLTRGTVYKTIDGGENWSRIWYGDNLARYILIHPDDHDLLYVSTGIFDREAANSDPETLEPGGVGVLRSVDGGLNWEELGVDNGFRADELYIGSLAMDSQDPNTLFAASGSDAHLFALPHKMGAIYRSQDGGDSWERVLDLPNASSVEICQSDPNKIYSGSANAIYRSDDGGATWQLVNGSADNTNLFWGPEEYIGGFPIDMQCDPDDANRIFVNNYGGGNFLSLDGGLTWSSASDGYTGAIMSTVVSAPGSPGLVFSSARSGIFVSYDGGEHWNGMARGVAHAMEAGAIAVDPSDHSHIVTVVGDAGPLPKITYDGGLTWQEAQHEVLNSETFKWEGMKTIIFSPVERGRLIGIQGMVSCDSFQNCPEGIGVIYSTDGAETWVQSNLKDGTAADLTYTTDGTAFVVHQGDLYRSTDGGATWVLVSEKIISGIGLVHTDPGLPGPAIAAIAVDPVDHSRMYAGAERGGLLISVDGGASWMTSSAGMVPETSIIDLVTDPAHPGVVYAASMDSGVYRSMDSGVTWQAINDGLSNRAAKSLSISLDGSYLYVATEGGGVFRLSPGGQKPDAAEKPMAVEVTHPADEESSAEEIERQEKEIAQMLEDDGPSNNPILYVVFLVGLGLIIGVGVIIIKRRPQQKE